MKRLFVILLFFFVISINTFSLSFFDDRNHAELAREILSSMSDEQALAQTFMLGWVGAEPSSLILDWIRQRNIGGVKIFGWNTDDTLLLARAIGTLQNAALNTQFSIPLFVATDQEGGLVRHVKGMTSETPGNMAIGASAVPMDAYWSGFYIGRELSLLGINMNFAPAIDLFTRRDSDLIGPRSFGNDPVQTGILGAAFARGLEAQGVIATAKHFPGHGDTNLDSHGVLPMINVSFETMWERELLPYRFMINEGVNAIMSGHLAFPQTAAGGTPASLSPWFLTDVLRDYMGFSGLIITDDLLMNGALHYTGSLSRAAQEAIMAGNDIIMLSQTPSLFDPVWNVLVQSMRDDPFFRNRVMDSALRIIEKKLKYLRQENHVTFNPDPDKVAQGIPDPQGAVFFLNLAARSVTFVKDTNDAGERVLPLRPGTANTATGAASSSGTQASYAGRVLLAGRYADFFTQGERAFPGAQTFRFQGRSAEELLFSSRNADTVIFCLSGANDLAFLRSLRNSGRRVIVFSILNPNFIEEARWVDGILAVYSYSRESFIAGFSAILGRIPAAGRFP